MVRRRRMVRDYDPERPVPAEVVRRLLEYAARAPSACFTQGWGFLVLTEPADREAFWAATTPVAAPSGGSPPADGSGGSPPADGSGGSPPADGSGPAAADGSAGRPGRSRHSRWLAGMRRAPLIVVPHTSRRAYLERYAEPDKGWTDRDEARWSVPYWYVDAGFASLLMLLGAVDEGLGACFFGIPPERVDGYRAAFGVPSEFAPVGAITVGYRAADRRSPSLVRGRRTIEEVAFMGRWGRPYRRRQESDMGSDLGVSGGDQHDD